MSLFAAIKNERRMILDVILWGPTIRQPRVRPAHARITCLTWFMIETAQNSLQETRSFSKESRVPADRRLSDKTAGSAVTVPLSGRGNLSTTIDRGTSFWSLLSVAIGIDLSQRIGGLYIPQDASGLSRDTSKGAVTGGFPRFFFIICMMKSHAESPIGTRGYGIARIQVDSILLVKRSVAIFNCKTKTPAIRMAVPIQR
ncbi:hypothetical protein DFH09DRAFT_1094160 [Mycena vulgaris]|nr:hypothetical protein DFH09DRAFT_1094160 [Mycena vulgaris]